ANHLAREVGDAHRTAHLEQIGGPGLARRRRLQDELTRLRDRHEVAGDLGIGDGHGTAAGYLLSEQWHDAAARSAALPATPGHEPTGSRTEAADDQLSGALGDAHD